MQEFFKKDDHDLKKKNKTFQSEVIISSWWETDFLTYSGH